MRVVFAPQIPPVLIQMLSLRLKGPVPFLNKSCSVSLKVLFCAAKGYNLQEAITLGPSSNRRNRRPNPRRRNHPPRRFGLFLYHSQERRRGEARRRKLCDDQRGESSICYWQGSGSQGQNSRIQKGKWAEGCTVI